MKDQVRNKSLVTARKSVRNTSMTMLKRWYDGCKLVYSDGSGFYFCDSEKIRGYMINLEGSEYIEETIQHLKEQSPKRHWLLPEQTETLIKWIKADEVPIYTYDGRFLVGDKWYSFIEPEVKDIETIFTEKHGYFDRESLDFIILEIAACYQNIENQGIETGKGLWREEILQSGKRGFR